MLRKIGFRTIVTGAVKSDVILPLLWYTAMANTVTVTNLQSLHFRRILNPHVYKQRNVHEKAHENHGENRIL